MSGLLRPLAASMNRTPSADFTRLGPTGTGATRRIHSQPPGHAAGVAEVVAHQALDARLRQRARIPQQLGRLLLQCVAEHVLVPLALEVQNRPDPQQELFRLVEPRGIGRSLLEQGRVGQPGDGSHGREVAQTARRLLDVRLQLIERGVEQRVPFVGQRRERLQQVRVERGACETSR